MLIQSTSNMAQASPSGKISSNGLANDGKPIVVSAPSSDSAVKLGVSLELPQVAAVQIAEEQASSSQLRNAADNINKVLKQSNKNLEFSVDTGTQKPIVKLIETDTGDLIRQYPTEEMLAISSAIDQFQQGVLLKQKA
ncbi:flagellar protein FlaG [Candidatus Nitrotoga sp. 1052]|uniref:flagellar protein FlaG n=1 Tax=Candidatus Nitrotoga sp. 1052 TaxID=2886964 RepID=UPI001EF48305|nr:flagellar protein FlaG [Candidatus Nitrotoga sp. 1052]CAH1073798.1 Flagellar protein FlaG [Candidatus Nitrotoga sp. 1052]